MRQNFDRAFRLIIDVEKGLSRDPHDAGNWTGGRVGKGTLRGTKYGISAAAYPKLDIANLSLPAAEEIYRQDYWRHLSGDELPLGLDYAAFDFAIHSHWLKAGMVLQETINDLVVGLENLATDGRIGPETLLHLDTVAPARLIPAYCAERLAFLGDLKTWSRYHEGWTTRVKNVETHALAMSQQGASHAPLA